MPQALGSSAPEILLSVIELLGHSAVFMRTDSEAHGRGEKTILNFFRPSVHHPSVVCATKIYQNRDTPLEMNALYYFFCLCFTKAANGDSLAMV